VLLQPALHVAEKFLILILNLSRTQNIKEFNCV
jgi:hypothetical protein